MHILYKAAAILIALAFIIIPVSADIEEIPLVKEDPNGNLHINEIEITVSSELPHHTELRPFFRETELIEIDREDDEDAIPNGVQDWFCGIGNSSMQDTPLLLNEPSSPEDK